jgi:hypothetical protein
VCNCLIDEGRPLGTGWQEQVPNHLRRLWSKAISIGRSSRHIPFRLRLRLPWPAWLFSSAGSSGCLLSRNFTADPFDSDPYAAGFFSIRTHAKFLSRLAPPTGHLARN